MEDPTWASRLKVSCLLQPSFHRSVVFAQGDSFPLLSSSVSRLPYDNLALAVLYNDEDYGSSIMEIVKNRLIDEILGLPKIDWNER